MEFFFFNDTEIEFVRSDYDRFTPSVSITADISYHVTLRDSVPQTDFLDKKALKITFQFNNVIVM
jgi:hypothetical protein